MFVNLYCEIQHCIILCFLLDHLGRPYIIYKLTLIILDTCEQAHKAAFHLALHCVLIKCFLYLERIYIGFELIAVHLN